MKTFIHIGQPKTATTSIQRYIQTHQAVLAEHGIWAPAKIAANYPPNYYELTLYALNKNRSSPEKDIIFRHHSIKGDGQRFLNGLYIDLVAGIEEIYADARRNKCDKVLFSSESLYLLNSVAEYERLVNLFRGNSTEVNVVCCFRHIESFSASVIRQLKSMGYSRSGDPDSFRYWEPDSWLFDYAQKKNLLSESFDNCLYFDYDSSDNVKWFFNALGVNCVADTRSSTEPIKTVLMK